MHGVGLPTHFVVGHFGVRPPLLLDVFDGGVATTRGDVPPSYIRPWGAKETALRMLNNLVAAYLKRMRIGDATLSLPLYPELPLEAVERVTAEHPGTGLALSSFVNDVLYEQFWHGQAIPPFSRHAVLHGADVDYATESNARTAVLAIEEIRDYLPNAGAP